MMLLRMKVVFHLRKIKDKIHKGIAASREAECMHV